MDDKVNSHLLKFKWSISHGRNTNGYNICSLYVDGKRVASCNGGNYDMMGTSLGEWIAKTFGNELKKLSAKQFYGLFFVLRQDGQTKYVDTYVPGASVYVDGACGLECMWKILGAFGWKYRQDLSRSSIRTHSNSAYVLERAEVPALP